MDVSHSIPTHYHQFSLSLVDRLRLLFLGDNAFSRINRFIKMEWIQKGRVLAPNDGWRVGCAGFMYLHYVLLGYNCLATVQSTIRTNHLFFFRHNKFVTLETSIRVSQNKFPAKKKVLLSITGVSVIHFKTFQSQRDDNCEGTN